MKARVRVEARSAYGKDWELLFETDTLGVTLMDRVYEYHKGNPTQHLAVYINEVLNSAFTPGGDYNHNREPPLYVEIDNHTYRREY